MRVLADEGIVREPLRDVRSLAGHDNNQNYLGAPHGASLLANMLSWTATTEGIF